MKKILLSIAVVCSIFAANAAVTAKVGVQFNSALGKFDQLSLAEGTDYTSGKDTYETGDKIMTTSNPSTILICSPQSFGNAPMVFTDNLTGTPISVATNQTETDYSFTFFNLDGRGLKMEDRLLDSIFDITATTVYEFTAPANTLVEGRFFIVDYLCYTRHLNPSQVFGTICYPYKAEKILGGKMYKMNYFDGTQLVLELEDNPVGGMPYVFEADNAESVKWYYKEENRVDDIADVSGFVGTYEAITTPADNMYLVSNNKVQNYAAGSTVGEYRAYIILDEVATENQYPASSPTRRLSFSVKKTPTDMSEMDADKLHDGLYMMNGQVVIVKDGQKYHVLGF